MLIDTEIEKSQNDLVKAKFDAIPKNLVELLEKEREQQAKEIMEAFIKSGKSSLDRLASVY